MTASTRRTSIYPLRLPAPIKAEAERLAASEGTSLNRFVAEKVAALRTASYFAERKGTRGLGGLQPARGPARRRAAPAA